MSQSAREFTVEEIEGLLPELSQLVEVQLERRQEIAEAITKLAETTGERPPTLKGRSSDVPSVRELRASIRQAIEDYEAGWHAIERLGAVVKDPDTGLLDFYGRVGGRLVWLCWRYGEETLGWYHELQAGFSGRRPLERNALLN